MCLFHAIWNPDTIILLQVPVNIQIVLQAPNTKIICAEELFIQLNFQILIIFFGRWSHSEQKCF